MKGIKMQLKRVLVTVLAVLAVFMIVGAIDMPCLQVNATEMESEATQGIVENVSYDTVHKFTDRQIMSPTAENFQTDIENPQYTFTWYRGEDTFVEPMDSESAPKKLGKYTLKIDVISQTNGMTASLTLPVTIEEAQIDAVATVAEELGGFTAWDEVVLAAPEGYAIAHEQSYWEFSGNPTTMLVVDPRGAVARLTAEGEVIYFLKELSTGYISKEKTIAIDVQEKKNNPPALGAIINGKALPQVLEEEEITYSYFFKNPAAINISGYKEYQIVSEGETYDANNEWTEDTGVFEFSENGAYNIYARTVEKGDGWESSLSAKMQGFIIYKDSMQRTYKLVYTKSTNLDKTIKVAFNENKVKNVVVGNTELSTDQYEVSEEGIILKGSYLEGLEAGEYAVTVSYNPYGREYVDAEGNEKPCQTEIALTIEEFDNDEAVITTEETGYKTETAEGVTEVPESLSNNPNLDTVEKIEQKMIESVLDRNLDITAENTETHEVTLLVKLPENEDWQEATDENFPKEGLTLTIAYPEGTSAETHDFVIAHMFTKDMNGHKAGDVEYPEVKETANGLTFTVTGLSPITLGWAKTDSEAPSGEGDSENTPSGDNASGGSGNNPSGANISSDSVHKSSSVELDLDEKVDNSNIVTNAALSSPATGDNANIVLWCLIMLGCAAVVVAAFKRKKEQC